MNPLAQRIGRRVRSLRRTRGLSVDDLGKAIGVSHTQITRVESGQQHMNCSQLLKASATLGVTPHDVLGWRGKGSTATKLSEAVHEAASQHDAAVLTDLLELISVLPPESLQALVAVAEASRGAVQGPPS